MTSMGTSRKIAASVTLTLTNGVPSMLQNSLADLARRERIPTVVRHQDGPIVPSVPRRRQIIGVTRRRC